ncbi:UNVERIFIED_CONTAM: Transposon Ty3-G Gag-Pol polyprotein [Sesamum indicum]
MKEVKEEGRSEEVKFISGLKEEVKSFISTCDHTSLNQAILLARKQKCIVNAIIRRSHQTQKNPAPKPPFRPQTRNPPPRNLDHPKRFLTEAEVRAKREKNLGYRCDELNVPGHRCKYKQVYMLLNDEECRGEDKKGQAETPTVKEVNEEDDVSVSLHAMRGSSCCKTLKICAKVKDKDILVLVNSRSTHCFLDEKIVEILDLKLESTVPMTVRVADGSKIVSDLICVGFKWEMQLRKVTPVIRSSKIVEPEEEVPEILKLLQLYAGVFAEPKSLPPERSIEHAIELIPEAIPKKQHPYRYAYGQKSEIERIVKEMLINGIIKPSKSSFASPVLLVKKKDGGWRLCVPYRYLNKLTVKHNFPIPVIDELLDELHGSKYFTEIDLRSGYFQIRMKSEDIPKTSFITHSGHYEFMVMPFGLCNAPSTFQALMNSIFEPYLRKFVLVFFYDILIYSKTWEEHLRHISEVEYLGHIISMEGVATDPQKIESMINWPIPTSVKALRGFLGLTGYYRKFIRNYGIISKPLTALLKKDAFKWNEEAETTFNQLKEVMTTSPVLAMPNFSQPFTVETNACGSGIGAVLMQQGHPIAYLSKALAPRNLGLSIYEKEFLALLMAITKWKHYLQGNHFVIKTDQRSLKYILDQRIESVMQQKGVTKLFGLSYEVQYKKGKENSAADALSRITSTNNEMSLEVVTTHILVWMQEVKNSYEGNTLFQTILQAKIVDSSSYPDYNLETGILTKGNRICIGSHGGVREKVIKSLHDAAVGGHSGINGIYQRVKSLFYWPTMRGDIETWVKECEVCQRAKHENLPYPGLLQPLPIPNQAWSCISMDFIEGLPNSEGKDSILVVVDRLTKYSHFIALKHPYNATTVVKLFFDHIYKLHGLPVSIVTDRDRIFTSRFWKELFTLSGVSLDMSSAYHPQSDGQTERVNQCLESYLRQCGYPPQQLSIGPYLQSHHSGIDELMQERVKTLQLLKDNLHQAQQKMKQYADKKRTEREFQVGDEVFLKLQPYRQTSMSLKKKLKLSAKYFGPYKVMERIGKVAYKLELPPGSKIHPIFHVSLLKKKIGPKYFPSVNLPELEDEVFKIYPAAILARRLIHRNNAGVPQVLIQWAHSSPDQATWEDYHEIAARFPGFDPWGQGSQKGKGNVALAVENATFEGDRPISRIEDDRAMKEGIKLGQNCTALNGNIVVLRRIRPIEIWGFCLQVPRIDQSTEATCRAERHA